MSLPEPLQGLHWNGLVPEPWQAVQMALKHSGGGGEVWADEETKRAASHMATASNVARTDLTGMLNL